VIRGQRIRYTETHLHGKLAGSQEPQRIPAAAVGIYVGELPDPGWHLTVIDHPDGSLRVSVELSMIEAAETEAVA
jgi:hypothetical protein